MVESSFEHSAWSDGLDATGRRCYIGGGAIVAGVAQQPWFSRLETLWLQDNTLPLGIVAG